LRQQITEEASGKTVKDFANFHKTCRNNERKSEDYNVGRKKRK